MKNISYFLYRVVFKPFLRQLRYMEKLQKFQKRYYRVIQIGDKAFFEILQFLKKWPHQIMNRKMEKLPI